ncbi:MAG: ATP-binding protein [Planctomycetota bacterium]
MSRAAQKFVFGYLILHLVAAGIFVAVLSRVLRNQMVLNAESRMMTMVTMLEGHINGLPDTIDDKSLPQYLKTFGDQTKLQFLLTDVQGNVTAASKSSSLPVLDSVGNQPEIIQAGRESWGIVVRESEIYRSRWIYVARKFTDPLQGSDVGYIRVSSPMSPIEKAVVSVQTYLWIFAIIVGALTALVTAAFTMKSMKPLTLFSQAARKIGIGDYSGSPSISQFEDEWAVLGSAFNQMQAELRVREARLVENNQRLEAVLSSMIEGVIAIQSDGTVVLANGAACEILSLTRPELIGRKLLEIVRNPELGQAVDATRLKRTFSETEFKIFSPVEKTISARVAILADVKHPGIAVVLHDVTDLRQLETMRRDFVANVSHELKTPLASIKAYAETLQLGAIHDTEKNIEFVEQIQNSADLLHHQIQDIIQLARVESREKVFTIAEIDLNLSAQTCHARFQEAARQNDLELQLDLHDRPVFAMVDFEAVSSILNNLVVNAIHYTPDKGSVCIQTRIEDDWAILNVVDTGIGIAEDQQARIFERFYRVDKARSRDMGGTGLGLAIVKHLCQTFHGSVVVESCIGKGSKFRIQFPIASDQQSDS